VKWCPGNHKKGRLHALIVANTTVGENGKGAAVGNSYPSSVCGSQNNAVSLSTYATYGPGSGSVIATGTTLAHEIAHKLGVYHGGDKKKGSKRKLGICSSDCKKEDKGTKCTETKTRHIMGGNGKLPKISPEAWGRCSREDFTKYFQDNQPFCLKTSTGNAFDIRSECEKRKPLKPCHHIKDRKTCLMSLDTRDMCKGPCGWCIGRKCPSPSTNLCEPTKWYQKHGLVEGKNYEECCTGGGCPVPGPL